MVRPVKSSHTLLKYVHNVVVPDIQIITGAVSDMRRKRCSLSRNISSGSGEAVAFFAGIGIRLLLNRPGNILSLSTISFLFCLDNGNQTTISLTSHTSKLS